MSKIAIVVCGNSSIDYLPYPDNISLIRSNLIMNGKEYEDFIDISAEEFYKTLQDEDPEVRTSQTATGVILTEFERLKEGGYTEAIVITISSHLSGTYQGVKVAADMIDDFKVYPFDSLTAVYPEAYMALTASKLASEGKSALEIITELEKVRENNRVLFVVDDLKYLVKNGRLSSASGFIGKVLKIKPLLEILPNGKIVAKEKIRTKAAAVKRLIEAVKEELENVKGEVQMFAVYTTNKEEIENLYFHDGVKIKDDNFIIAPIAPVVGAHIGAGAFGIGYIKKY